MERTLHYDVLAYPCHLLYGSNSFDHFFGAVLSQRGHARLNGLPADDIGVSTLKDEVLNLVKERAKARNISRIVLASTTGYTAGKAMGVFANGEIQLIVVPHQLGFDKPESKFPKELVTTLEEKGHKVHFPY